MARVRGRRLTVEPAAGIRVVRAGVGYVFRVKQRTVLADVRGARVERAAAALGARLAPLSSAAPPPPGPPRATLAFAAPEDWPALVRRLRGPFSTPLLVCPLGAPRALPEPFPAIARFVLPSQRAARAWGAFVPLGRLVVVEPSPEAGEAGVYVADEADALDPERIVAAARAGAAIVSRVAHDVLPPGAVVSDDPAAAARELGGNAARLAALGAFSRGWAARGRLPADEAAAWRAVTEEVESMARRGL